jgi:hypothetical protein
MSAGLHLLGHNLGLGDDVTIRTRADGKLLDLSLQDALWRIDEFDDRAQAHLIAALPFAFQLTGGGE